MTLNEDRVEALIAQMTRGEMLAQLGNIVLTAGLSSREAAGSGTFRLTGSARRTAERSRILETGVRIVR